MAEIFLQHYFNRKPVFVHFGLFVTKEFHFIGELAFSDIWVASSNVNSFSNKKARRIASTEVYNKSVMVSTCC